MVKKTASALDFLKVSPSKSKRSVTEYELLAKQASDRYLDSNEDPNKIIADLAKQRGYNDEQVKRVIEFTNHEINSRLSKTSEDQLFTFPVATLESVKKYAYEKQEKSADFRPEVDIDFGVYEKLAEIPDYADLAAARVFNRRIESASKTAGAEEEDTSGSSEIEESWRIERELKKLATDVEMYSLAVRDKLSKLAEYYSYIKNEDSQKDEMALALATMLPDPESSVKIASLVGGEDLQNRVVLVYDRGEDLEKAANYIDPSHEIVSNLVGLSNSLEKLSSVLEKRSNLTEGAKNLAKGVVSGAKSMGRRFSAARRSTKNPLVNVSGIGKKYTGAKAALGLSAGIYTTKKIHDIAGRNPVTGAAVRYLLPKKTIINTFGQATVGKNLIPQPPGSLMATVSGAKRGLSLYT